MNKILMVVATFALALPGLSQAQQVVRTVTTTATRSLPDAPLPMQRTVVLEQRPVVNQVVTRQMMTPERHFRQCRRMIHMAPNGERVVRVKCSHHGWNRR